MLPIVSRFAMAAKWFSGASGSAVGWAKRSVPTVSSTHERVGAALRAFAHPTALLPLARLLRRLGRRPSRASLSLGRLRMTGLDQVERKGFSAFPTAIVPRPGRIRVRADEAALVVPLSLRAQSHGGGA